MRTITPHLWFDREAIEAAEFYTSAVPNSKVTNVTTLHDTPSGDTDIVSFTLSGRVTEAFLKRKKLDIAELQSAYETP